jgi:hypothetical protein
VAETCGDGAEDDDAGPLFLLLPLLPLELVVVQLPAPLVVP